MPPVRVTVMTAEPAASLTENVAAANLMMPPASASPMVSTALARGPMATAGAVDELAPLKVSSTVFEPATTLSVRIFTGNDIVAMLGANVRTPDVAT